MSTQQNGIDFDGYVAPNTRNRRRLYSAITSNVRNLRVPGEPDACSLKSSDFFHAFQGKCRVMAKNTECFDWSAPWRACLLHQTDDVTAGLEDLACDLKIERTVPGN